MRGVRGMGPINHDNSRDGTAVSLQVQTSKHTATNQQALGFSNMGQSCLYASTVHRDQTLMQQSVTLPAPCIDVWCALLQTHDTSYQDWQRTQSWGRATHGNPGSCTATKGPGWPAGVESTGGARLPASNMARSQGWRCRWESSG
jgi:hypothetical protein